MLLYSIFQFATIFLFLLELFLEFCYCIISFLHTEIKEGTLSLSSKGTDASKLSVTRTAKLNVYGIMKQLSPGIKTFYNVLFNILIKVGTNRVTSCCIGSMQQTLPWVLFLKKCSSFSCCYQMYKFKLLWIYARKKISFQSTMILFATGNCTSVILFDLKKFPFNKLRQSFSFHPIFPSLPGV